MKEKEVILHKETLLRALEPRKGEEPKKKGIKVEIEAAAPGTIKLSPEQAGRLRKTIELMGKLGVRMGEPQELYDTGTNTWKTWVVEGFDTIEDRDYITLRDPETEERKSFSPEQYERMVKDTKAVREPEPSQ